MKNILLLVIGLMSFVGFSQYEEEDTTTNYTTYYLLEHSTWKVDQFVPSEDNIQYDALTKIMYNNYVNMEVLDSIIKYRESKGFKPFKIDNPKEYKKAELSMIWHSMDISSSEKSKVVLAEIEDPEPDCDCKSSIFENIINDSIIDEKNFIFRNHILNNNIKSIEVNYYQVIRKNSETEEEHLVVKIKRRYRLFKITYILI